MNFDEIMRIVLPVVGGAFASYLAIRSDLSDLKARMIITEKNADDAHNRIDAVYLQNQRDRK